MNLFKPPVPPIQKRRPFFVRMLLGMQRCYLANFIEKSYEMKMGHIWLPGRDIYMPNTTELVRKILVDDALLYPKSDMVGKMLRMVMGDGVFVSNGERWKQQRRLIDPAFVLAKLRRVFPLMWQAISDLHERLASREDDTHPVEIDEEMTYVTADVIFRTIFSQPITPEQADRLFDAFTRFQEAAFVYGFLDSTKIPNIFAWRHRGKAEKAGSDIRAIMEPLVKARYDRYERGEDLEDDILTSLITGVDPGTGFRFSYEELVDQISFLFLAGHETSASALSWALYLVSMVPSVQDRMATETHDVLGDRDPAFGDLNRLAFTRDVFREALRLYPPVGFLPREASKPETMRGKNIVPGDVMLISPWLMHRHRDYWEMPDHFDPDRFSRKACAHAVRSAYLPFSVGPRICTGAGFAQQEAVLILATIVQRYRVEPVDGHVPKPVGRLTVRSENGMPLKLVRR